jgi:hypothetical protein
MKTNGKWKMKEEKWKKRMEEGVEKEDRTPLPFHLAFSSSFFLSSFFFFFLFLISERGGGKTLIDGWMDGLID